MPAPYELCHREPESSTTLQTWGINLGFHQTLLPINLQTQSCKHTIPSKPASSSSKPRVFSCLVHAVTSSKRRVPRGSETFQKVLEGIDSEMDASDSDVQSDSSESAKSKLANAKYSVANDKQRTSRCACRRSASSDNRRTSHKSASCYSLNRRDGRRVHWADEGCQSDLVTVHLIRPRLKASESQFPSCFPVKSILKGATSG